MDFTRVTSPPSIRVHDHNGNHSRRPSSSWSTGGSFSRTPGPMAIPNTRHDDPPPPLPPPRIIHDLSAGRDPGWEWGNNLSGGFGKGAGASMAGPNFPKSWTKKAEHNGQDEKSQRPEYNRRESSTSTIKSPADTDRGYDFGRRQDEGYYSLSTSRPSVMSQQSVYTFSTGRSYIAFCLSRMTSYTSLWGGSYAPELLWCNNVTQGYSETRIGNG